MASTQAPDGLSKPATGFMDGSRGASGENRLAWSRYVAAPMAGIGIGGGLTAAPIVSERALAAGVSTQMLTANPTISTIVSTLTADTCGSGLTLSLKLGRIADRIGLTEKQARDLGHEIEGIWRTWAGSPEEADANGLVDFHSLAGAGFSGWLLTGELVAAYDWRPSRFAESGTKVCLLDPRHIASDRTITEPDGYSFQGISFDRNARFQGLWLRRQRLGDINHIANPVAVPAFTSFGRRKLSFIFEPLLPGQPRGVSPIIGALSPALERQMLQENVTAAFSVQSMAAITLESDLPGKVALDGLEPPSGHGSFDNWCEEHESFYGEGNHIKLQPGTVNTLLRGDKLKMNRFQPVDSEYAAFEASLTREAARAAGAMSEQISGDFSDVNFSASRMASFIPSRITARRRRAILERFYREAFSLVLEEYVARGLIEWPENAKPFDDAHKLIVANATFIGGSTVTPDEKKAADAAILRLENNLSTLEDELGARGLDLEEVLDQRVRELQMLKERGLFGVEVYPGATSTQYVHKEVEEPDGDEQQQPATPDPLDEDDTTKPGRNNQRHSLTWNSKTKAFDDEL